MLALWCDLAAAYTAALLWSSLPKSRVACRQENPDENLLVAVGDALPALAAALGPDTYAPIFAQQHAEALFKWMRGSQPDSVRAAGMGQWPHCPFLDHLI